MTAHQQLSVIIRNQAKLMSVPELVPETTATISPFWSVQNEFMGSNHLSERPVLRPVAENADRLEWFHECVNLSHQSRLRGSTIRNRSTGGVQCCQ